MTTPEPALSEKIIALQHVLSASELPFAFGGALALAYYAEPRATVDVDVNIFVSPEAVDDVAEALGGLAIRTSAADRRIVRRDGQVRLQWGVTPVDLFFAYDPFHYHAAQRVRRVPFGSEAIVILAPEDLMVCKVVFNRRKDWIDIEQMLLITAGSLDVDDVRRWTERIVGVDDERLLHFDRTLAEVFRDQ